MLTLAGPPVEAFAVVGEQVVAVGPGEALALYTTAGAYASGEQDTKGRLAPGYLADFFVLGADPTEAEPEQLAEVPVRATYVGGRRVWPMA